MSMRSIIFRLIKVALFVYIVAAGIVFLAQDKIIYHPLRGTEADFLESAKRKNVEPWRNAQGQIIGWHRTNPRAGKRLVVFNGNAGSALDRSFYIDAFQTLGGGTVWDVWLFEYPGYGPRPGTIGKDAFIAAGREALQQLLSEGTHPVFLLGESVGGGVACALAAEMPDRISGLALVVPFARMEEVAQEKFRLLPVKYLLRDKYDNIAALASFRKPVAFAIAEKDDVIGPAQGHKLHDSYAGPKLLHEFRGADHNSFDTRFEADWFGRIGDFLREGRCGSDE